MTNVTFLRDGMAKPFLAEKALTATALRNDHSVLDSVRGVRAGGRFFLMEDAPIAPEVPESEVGASDSEFWGLPDFRILLGASSPALHHDNDYPDPPLLSVIVVT